MKRESDCEVGVARLHMACPDLSHIVKACRDGWQLKCVSHLNVLVAHLLLLIDDGDLLLLAFLNNFPLVEFLLP
eukprot:2641495-Amphidinium_carterae.1